jgi:hypothetical protein
MRFGCDSPHETTVNVRERDDTRRNERDGLDTKSLGDRGKKRKQDLVDDKTKKAPTNRKNETTRSTKDQ